MSEGNDDTANAPKKLITRRSTLKLATAIAAFGAAMGMRSVTALAQEKEERKEERKVRREEKKVRREERKEHKEERKARREEKKVRREERKERREENK